MCSTGRRQPVSPANANDAPMIVIMVRRVMASGGRSAPSENSGVSASPSRTAGESSSRSRLRQYLRSWNP